jgi:hypothetical protein
MTIKKKLLGTLLPKQPEYYNMLNTQNFAIAWNTIVKAMKSKAAYSCLSWMSFSLNMSLTNLSMDL